MDAFVTALTGGTDALAVSTYFDSLASLVPILKILIPVSLALMFLRKIVKGAGKGKVKF